MAEKTCPYWRDYDSIQGRVCFCALAAFDRRPASGELKALGCTREKRTQCFNTMKMVMGAGCVPGEVEGGSGAAAERVGTEAAAVEAGDSRARAGARRVAGRVV